LQLASQFVIDQGEQGIATCLRKKLEKSIRVVYDENFKNLRNLSKLSMMVVKLSCNFKHPYQCHMLF
jgi:hypothetical protein